METNKTKSNQSSHIYLFSTDNRTRKQENKIVYSNTQPICSKLPFLNRLNATTVVIFLSLAIILCCGRLVYNWLFFICSSSRFFCRITVLCFVYCQQISFFYLYLICLLIYVLMYSLNLFVQHLFIIYFIFHYIFYLYIHLLICLYICLTSY